MITTRYIRENIDLIKESLARRKSSFPIEKLIELDREMRTLKTELQNFQEKRNRSSMEISKLKKSGGDIKAKVDGLSELKKEIELGESRSSELKKNIDMLLWNLPNILHKEVPIGDSDKDNPEIRYVGDIIRGKSESHESILDRLGLLDIESASKTAGSRFYYLKGDLVMLEQSLLRFALDELVGKGFIPIAPPYMLKRRYYKSAVPLESFEEMLYSASEPLEASGISEYERLDEELFLIATAEHPLAVMHAEKVFSGKELPLKYVGISPSFRREAGSHGKDTKGIFRVHQFNKVEQFIFSDEETSWEYHEELLKNSEDIIKKLGIPYRVIEICTGDISKKDARSYDIEGYMPSQGIYKELSSCSNCTNWQSLRLDIKYDRNGKRRYVHTLNATGIAAERMLVAIVENYVNDDKTITVPKVLVPYMGKEVIGNKTN